MLPSERHVWSPKHLGQKVKEPRIDVDFLAKHLSSVFWRVRKPLHQTKRKHQRNLFSQCEWSTQPVFSRMRSEGFPFIVGVWGWTCVRFVLLPRRRVVVVSSSRRRRQLVNFSLLGGTHALRHHPVFQSMKSGASLARNARFGAPKSQNVRSFSCFAWQAQYFGSDSMQARRFFVAGAALCDVAFRDVVAGAAFCDVAKVLFP